MEITPILSRDYTPRYILVRNMFAHTIICVLYIYYNYWTLKIVSLLLTYLCKQEDMDNVLYWINDRHDRKI